MSLEGLGALIQLESTRLEGARQTSQNFQQANSAVQQVGAQTAQAKTAIWTQKIEATYSKEVQEATVRKLESRLARERKAETLAKNIAMTVTGVSALSNAWDAASDLLGKQKLGDIPSYLQTPKIDPATATVVTTPKSDSTDSTVWAIGKPDTKTGVVSVQCMTQSNNGAMNGAKSAVIGDYDIKSVLGNTKEYTELAKKGPVTFESLVKNNPELAMRVMEDKAHSIGKAESSDFVSVLKAHMPSDDVARMDHTTPPSPEIVAAKKSITDAIANPTNAVAALAKLKDVSILKDVSVEVDGKTAPVKVSDLNPEDLKSKDFNKNLEAAMQLAQTAELLKENGRPQNYSVIMSGNNVTMLDKDRNTSTTIKLTPEQATEFRNNIKNNKNEAVLDAFAKAETKANAETNVDSNKGNITKVTGVQEAAKDFQMKVNSATAYKSAVDSLKAVGKLDKNHDNVFGKALSVVGDVGSAGMNFIVNTAKDSAPYFQAYLAQKSRADAVEEELMEARQKLAAENKKLKNIQMQIDLFNGRGS